MEITEVIGAAVLVLLGAVITAAITYIGTKQHDNAQINMHRNTLQQQTNEARRDRIVEARKPLLIELRESLSREFGLYASFKSAALVAQDIDDPTPLAHIEAMRDEINHTAQLVPQISDTTLKTAIEAYNNAFIAILPEPGSSPAERLQNLLATTAPTTAQQHLFNINKRIEELLAGDDPT